MHHPKIDTTRKPPFQEILYLRNASDEYLKLPNIYFFFAGYDQKYSKILKLYKWEKLQVPIKFLSDIHISLTINKFRDFLKMMQLLFL